MPCKFVPFECVELVGGEVQGRPEFVWWREHVEVWRVNEEGVITAGESGGDAWLAFLCGRDIREGGKKKRKGQLHMFRLAIQWKQMYMMVIWHLVQHSKLCVT